MDAGDISVGHPERGHFSARRKTQAAEICCSRSTLKMGQAVVTVRNDDHQIGQHYAGIMRGASPPVRRPSFSRPYLLLLTTEKPAPYSNRRAPSKSQVEVESLMEASTLEQPASERPQLCHAKYS
jgi:hypothetical protein